MMCGCLEVQSEQKICASNFTIIFFELRSAKINYKDVAENIVIRLIFFIFLKWLIDIISTLNLAQRSKPSSV